MSIPCPAQSPCAELPPVRCCCSGTRESRMTPVRQCGLPSFTVRGIFPSPIPLAALVPVWPSMGCQCWGRLGRSSLLPGVKLCSQKSSRVMRTVPAAINTLEAAGTCLLKQLQDHEVRRGLGARALVCAPDFPRSRGRGNSCLMVHLPSFRLLPQVPIWLLRLD